MLFTFNDFELPKDSPKKLNRPVHFYKTKENNLFLTEAQINQKKISEVEPLPNENLNIISPIKQIPESASLNKQRKIKTRQNIAKKRYFREVKRMNYFDPDNEKFNSNNDYGYNLIGLLPFVYFFKYLAIKVDNAKSSQLLKINLPDTIVINDGDLLPFWLYTNKEGYLKRTENFVMKDVFERLGNNENPDELISLLKKPHYESQTIIGNDLKLMSTRELTLWSNGMMLGKKGDMNVIQRFIKSKGGRASICRTVWKKNKRPNCWIISNKVEFNNTTENEINKFLTNIHKLNACSIIEKKTGKFLEETLPFLENIVKFIENKIPVKFEEISGDFIKDENELWWLINIKGLKLIDQLSFTNDQYLKYYEEPFNDYPSPKKLLPVEKYKNMRRCKYCELLFELNQLTYKISLRMLIQTDLHLINRGKNFPWLKRSLNVKALSSDTLCKEYPVCLSCYTLYKSIEDLSRIEVNFAKKCGIKAPKNSLYSDTISVTKLMKQNKPRSKSWHIPKIGEILNHSHLYQMPLDWSFQNDNENLVVINDKPRKTNNNQEQGELKNCLYRYRLIIYLSFLRKIPKSFDLKKAKIEYEIFGKTYSFLLGENIQKLQEKYDDFFMISLNKLNTFYFFCIEKKDIRLFLENIKNIRVCLIQNQYLICEANFELHEFASDLVCKRDFYKFMQTDCYAENETEKLMIFGLNMSIGLYEGDYINIVNIPLRKHHDIYLPPHDYYACDPFPEEWMSLIKEKNSYN